MSATRVVPVESMTPKERELNDWIGEYCARILNTKEATK